MSADRIALGDLPIALRHLLSHLTAFRVKVWQGDSDEGMGVDLDREVEADLSLAQVVSSRRTYPASPNRPFHAVVLDIDHRAWLVPSTNSEHGGHLYIDVACNEAAYFDLLRALAKCGVIEQGYADVSIQRGHTDVRLPWVKKGDPLPEDVTG